MDVRAAVAHKAGAPLTIETVQLEGPRAGEVLVEIKATGICHTDEFTLSGADPEGLFPAIFGTKGAGIVVDVGPGVTIAQEGDHVIPLYTPECRAMRILPQPEDQSLPGDPHDAGQGSHAGRHQPLLLNGKPIHHYMGTSTFANFTVLPEIALAKIRKTRPSTRFAISAAVSRPASAP